MDPSPHALRPMIRLQDVSKRYRDGTVAVHDLSLDVPDGRITVLIGPSGCGKTTTLKMINRLIEPTSGRIFVDNVDVTRSDPVKLRRSMGYVIQTAGLFPHLTVAGNVATVPTLVGWDRRRIRERTTELLQLVGLDPAVFARRYPHELSGGQRQRVGVARALAADPPVLLMDEPFGAVDPIARDRLQGEFLQLQRALRKTVVFVTHDLEEAVRLGDRIAVLRQGGVLEQYDTPQRILGSPATEFVAAFVGGDRSVRQLSVTRIDPAALEQPPRFTAGAPPELDGAGYGVVVDDQGRPTAWVTTEPGADTTVARVPLQATLREALAEMLQRDTGRVAVTDEDRLLGVLTPTSLHRALRRSIEPDGD